MSSLSIIQRIDKELEIYYKSNGVNDYLNNDGVGKFLEYCNSEGFEDENLEDEIGPDTDFEDCSLLEFDNNMPISLPKTAKIDNQCRYNVLVKFYAKCLSKTWKLPGKSNKSNKTTTNDKATQKIDDKKKSKDYVDLIDNKATLDLPDDDDDDDDDDNDDNDAKDGDAAPVDDKPDSTYFRSTTMWYGYDYDPNYDDDDDELVEEVIYDRTKNNQKLTGIRIITNDLSDLNEIIGILVKINKKWVVYKSSTYMLTNQSLLVHVSHECKFNDKTTFIDDIIIGDKLYAIRFKTNNLMDDDFGDDDDDDLFEDEDTYDKCCGYKLHGIKIRYSSKLNHEIWLRGIQFTWLHNKETAKIQKQNEKDAKKRVRTLQKKAQVYEQRKQNKIQREILSDAKRIEHEKMLAKQKEEEKKQKELREKQRKQRELEEKIKFEKEYNAWIKKETARRKDIKVNIHKLLNLKDIDYEDTIPDRTFRDIDLVLALFYDTISNMSYYDNDDVDDDADGDDDNKKGKFLYFCEENGCDVDDLQDDLFDTNAEDSLFVVFDELLFSDQGFNDDNRLIAVHNLLKYVYKYNNQPNVASNSLMTFNDYNMNISNKAIAVCKDIFKFNKLERYLFVQTDKNWMNAFAIGFQENNFCFLLYLMDSYQRDRLEVLLSGNGYFGLDEWSKNKKTKFQNQNLYLAMQSDQRYFRKTFDFQTKDKMIFDNIEEISYYINSFTNFIQNICNVSSSKSKQFPIQIDCLIAVKDVKYYYYKPPNSGDDDDDDNDSDDDNDKKDDINDHKSGIIGDIKQRLESNKCIFINKFIQNNNNIDDKYKNIKLKLNECYNEFKTKLNINNYPKNRRFCILIDRRYQNEANEEKDELIMYETADDTSSISICHIPQTMNYLSSKCLIPPININNLKSKITMDSDINGELLSFSFHIESLNEIRCYLNWFGKCLRFYPQDILTVFPKIFKVRKDSKNETFIKSDKLKKIVKNITIKDENFEHFYRDFSNKTSKQFPMQII